tara:strand:+ start:55 stop:1455 length:1401 start_codon:yes stop_codon:yes gene_type:complete
MGLRKIFDRLGDMFMPKELAPYAGMIAPMITPFAGIGAGLALSQLGSAKQNSGKLDPYSAFGVVAAGNTPQARARRMAGRIDPSQGTLGQRLSGGIADSGIFGNEANVLNRAIDPRLSMARQTHTVPASLFTKGAPGTTDIKSYFESPSLAAAMQKEPYMDARKFTKDGVFDKKAYFEALEQGYLGDNNALDIERDSLFDQDKTGSAAERDPETFKNILEGDKAIRYGEIATIDNLTAAEKKTLEKYKAFDAKNGTNTADSYIEKLGRRKDGTQGFFGDAIEGASEFAMPGFTTDNKFDFSKAVTTIGTATTLGSMTAIKEELKKQKMKDKEEEQKVYRAWFEQYERVTGKPYNQSPYPEDFLKEKYADIYGAFATGGRVGYNMGGGIMSAPGVPNGMQIDGREGMFISQGVEEKADDVPAMLSKNEFVLTADAMAGLDKLTGGSGDPRAAAKEMYRIMDQLEAMA